MTNTLVRAIQPICWYNLIQLRTCMIVNHTCIKGVRCTRIVTQTTLLENNSRKPDVWGNTHPNTPTTCRFFGGVTLTAEWIVQRAVENIKLYTKQNTTQKKLAPWPWSFIPSGAVQAMIVHLHCIVVPFFGCVCGQSEPESLEPPATLAFQVASGLRGCTLW